MLEVADIFREVGPGYRERFGARMLPSHLKAMRDIEACRTAVLGGHLRKCDRCGNTEYSYHSCCNRHCPKCHGDQTERWLASWRSRLLPCPYFLLTFTLPQELRSLAHSNQRLVYDILMQSAASALLKLAADPRYLGARPGMIAVLHTWTRAMLYHPHVHILVTAGGLSSDGNDWVQSKNPAFLLPARALSIIFRAKVRDALAREGLLDRVPRKTFKRKWVVHCQHAGNGEKVLEYLGRYVHRIAIANSRLERFENGEVAFRYQDNRTGDTKHCRVEAEEFIRRFLQHVLPRSFVKVRSYGIYSSGTRPLLDQAHQLVSPCKTRTLDNDDSGKLPLHASTADPDVRPPEFPCPTCTVGTMRIVATLPRGRRPP